LPALEDFLPFLLNLSQHFLPVLVEGGGHGSIQNALDMRQLKGTFFIAQSFKFWLLKYIEHGSSLLLFIVPSEALDLGVDKDAHGFSLIL
jgi:hypothetical protein